MSGEGIIKYYRLTTLVKRNPKKENSFVIRPYSMGWQLHDSSHSHSHGSAADGGGGGGGKHSHTENINVRAAFIHVLGDVCQSCGVFIAALLIYFKPTWQLADPICTFVFSIVVLATTITILKDALLVSTSAEYIKMCNL